MKTHIFTLSIPFIRNSGVAQAMSHQRIMLEKCGVEVTTKSAKGCDVVHINTIFPADAIMALISRIKGRKVICYGHSTKEDFKNSFTGSNKLAGFMGLWLKFCYSLGHVVITPTAYSKGLLESYGIKRPIYDLSNGVDIEFFSNTEERQERFRKKFNLSKEDKVIMSVGHFIIRKGIIEFIELARSLPQYKFFWFGYTASSIIPRKVSKAIKNAPPNLTFPGFIKQDELRDAYCGADLFAFMSTEETEGIVILEALACKTPTLVRNIPVYSGWLVDGENCVKAESTEEFRDKLVDIMEGRITVPVEAERRLAESRSYDVLGKKLLAIYEKEFGLNPDS